MRIYVKIKNVVNMFLLVFGRDFVCHVAYVKIKRMNDIKGFPVLFQPGKQPQLKGSQCLQIFLQAAAENGRNSEPYHLGAASLQRQILYCIFAGSPFPADNGHLKALCQQGIRHFFYRWVRANRI